MIDHDFKNSEAKPRGLGRGLNALFEDEEGVYPQIDSEGHTPGRKRQMLGIEQLHPGKFQPRKHFDLSAIEELAKSISAHGVLQPLLVRADPVAPGMYEIIAGERRWRASQKAQLHEVPVIILELGDSDSLEVALIENLQREDLDPIEEANGYQSLLEKYGHTQDQLAKAVGKSRSHIANMIRLLALPESIQEQVSSKQLSMGHARALITAEHPVSLAQEIIEKGLSVRQAEKLAAETSGRAQKTRTRKGSPANSNIVIEKDQDTLALEHDMSNVLGMKVVIDTADGRSGILKIEFKSLDQLDELLQRLVHSPGRLANG